MPHKQFQTSLQSGCCSLQHCQTYCDHFKAIFFPVWCVHVFRCSHAFSSFSSFVESLEQAIQGMNKLARLGKTSVLITSMLFVHMWVLKNICLEDMCVACQYVFVMVHACVACVQRAPPHLFWMTLTLLTSSLHWSLHSPSRPAAATSASMSACKDTLSSAQVPFQESEGPFSPETHLWYIVG
jgi:hypothetical protein